jgi:hypothetical protein
MVQPSTCWLCMHAVDAHGPIVNRNSRKFASTTFKLFFSSQLTADKLNVASLYLRQLGEVNYSPANETSYDINGSDQMRT